MVPAEGGGLLIIEEYERAKARGAKIYAELVGFGASQDTYKVTDPEPSGHSYAMAITKALKDASVSAADVGLVIPNGLGIASHDRVELAGLKQALGTHLPDTPMSLTKAQTGTMAAGSGVEVGTSVLAVAEQKIPPSINTKKPVDGAKLNVSSQVRDAKIDVCVSSVYSLGGQNAALVFKRV
jgi:3-oxoacyl-[acyl-carrier-protein] synthase II